MFFSKVRVTDFLCPHSHQDGLTKSGFFIAEGFVENLKNCHSERAPVSSVLPLRLSSPAPASLDASRGGGQDEAAGEDRNGGESRNPSAWLGTGLFLMAKP